ncbi:MAG: carbohydrate ABC transporter permease [Clostridiales bacterium]|jgi:ABC-type glycerol-3-phosphate transport system permease component|nr:carbohydrate ABC transporter permease [Clostridiales bacterium]
MGIAEKKRPPLFIAATIIITSVSAIIILFPLYWVLITSLKGESEIFALPPSFIPNVVTNINYIFAFTETKIPIYFLNSVSYALGTLVVVLFCASTSAYSMSRFKFKGKAAYLLTILLTQLMPMTTLIVPLYVSFGTLGLMNNRFALIAVYAAIQTPIATWLLLGYFNSIPAEIDEAARIDGCTNLGILWRVVLPLSKPGLMAVSLSVIISVWQELMLAMTFTSIDELRPLMAGVSAAITRAGIKWGQMNATAIIACAPIIVIYIFLQRNLVEGLTGGAVKG